LEAELVVVVTTAEVEALCAEVWVEEWEEECVVEWEVLVLHEVDLWSAAGRAETKGAANKPKLSSERIDIVDRM
jgi:hypothetical protein